MNKEYNVRLAILFVLAIICIAVVCYSYEMKYIKEPLNDFCQQQNNSNLTEYKSQICFSGSDFLIKCTNGKIYGIDEENYCVEWDIWGDCIKMGKKQFKLSHLTYPKC